MAEGLIGALRVTLSADTAQFTKGMSQAERKAATSGAAIERSLSSVKRAVAGFAAGISVASVVAVAQRALEYASSLGEVSQQLGVTTKDLQEYRYAATQVGISQEEMDKALAKLTVTMGKARAGVKEPAAAFKALSDILGKDILKSAATAGDALPLMADAFAKIKDPAARAAAEISFFGKTGQKLDTLLAGGSAAINELRDAAQSLGIVLSDEQIQSADRTADKLSELKTVLEANIAGAVANNSKAIYDFVDSLSRLISEIPSAIRSLQNLDLQLQIAGARGRQINPFLTPGMRDNARKQEIVANYQLQRNKVVDALAKAPKSTRDAILRFYPSGTAERLGLQPPGGVDQARPRSVGAGAGAGGGSKRHGKSAEQIAREAERAAEEQKRNQAEYQNNLARSQMEEIDARADLSQGVRDRYAAEMARIDMDRTQAANALSLEKGLTDEQRKALGASQEAVFATREVIAERNKNIALLRTDYEIQAATSDAVQDELRGRISMARSIAERRDLELQLLAERKKAEAAYLNMVLSTSSTSSAEYQNALNSQKTLDARYGAQASQVEHDNMGPMAQYADSLPKTAAEIQEAFESAAVNGIRSMNDELAESVANMLGLHGAAGQFLTDLIKIGAQLLQNALAGNSGGGGGIGGFLGGLGKLVGLAGGAGGGGWTPGADIGDFSSGGWWETGAIPGLVGGGSIKIAGNRGLDTNLMSINGMPVARVNHGETVKVEPNNDNGRGGSPVSFDLRGAVMLPDLMAQMESIANQTSGRVVGDFAKRQARTQERTLSG